MAMVIKLLFVCKHSLLIREDRTQNIESLHVSIILQLPPKAKHSRGRNLAESQSFANFVGRSQDKWILSTLPVILWGHQMWRRIAENFLLYGSVQPGTPRLSLWRHTLFRHTTSDYSLTFVGPCIVIYFYSITNQMHNIPNLFYFGTTLYRFRSFRPSSGV
jgi:hypothetical protein